MVETELENPTEILRVWICENRHVDFVANEYDAMGDRLFVFKVFYNKDGDFIRKDAIACFRAWEYVEWVE